MKVEYIIGDCSELMKEQPSKQVDLVITDPPYYLPINSYVGTRKEGYEHRTFLNLTKNPEGLLNWERYWRSQQSYIRQPFPLYPPNLWLGVSVEGPDQVDRLLRLQEVHHDKKFVSFEPLLGDVVKDPQFSLAGIGWVILGQQTGPGAVDPFSHWGMRIIETAQRAKIPVFLKDNMSWIWAPQPREFPEGMP